MNKNLLILVLVIIGVSLIGISSPKSSTVPYAVSMQTMYPNNPPLSPNPILTPGAKNPDITQANISQNICKKGYTSGLDFRGNKVRNVSESTKNQVYKEYGIDKTVGGPYEVDHLISLELGGSNDIKNLWPQSYVTQPYNARNKDALENRLHAMVCSGNISLAQAQKEISIDWISAYRKYFGK